MKAEINFFQDGIARRIADEYLGLAIRRRKPLAFGAITIMEPAELSPFLSCSGCPRLRDFPLIVEYPFAANYLH